MENEFEAGAKHPVHSADDLRLMIIAPPSLLHAKTPANGEEHDFDPDTRTGIIA